VDAEPKSFCATVVEKALYHCYWKVLVVSILRKGLCKLNPELVQPRAISSRSCEPSGHMTEDWRDGFERFRTKARLEEFRNLAVLLEVK